jgi:hypothetical protein
VTVAQESILFFESILSKKSFSPNATFLSSTLTSIGIGTNSVAKSYIVVKENISTKTKQLFLITLESFF